MSSVHWNASVVDSPDFEPFTVVGDLVLVVRTPRSRDFVTVEVGPAPSWLQGGTHPTRPPMTSEPLPILTNRLRAEIHTGDTMDFRLEGESYHLTLARVTENPHGSPWVACDFHLERD